MRTLLAICLLTLCLPAAADQRLFYQPLNRDASVTPAQWQQLWRATAAQGGKTLIVQWSAYGDSDFGGAKGWLANSLREARAQGLELVLGLYMDPSYYQRLEQLDGEGLSSYWKAQLGVRWASTRNCGMVGSWQWTAGTCPWSWTTCTFASRAGATRCTANCRHSTGNWTSPCISVLSAWASWHRGSTAHGWVNWQAWV